MKYFASIIATGVFITSHIALYSFTLAVTNTTGKEISAKVNTRKSSIAVIIAPGKSSLFVPDGGHVTFSANQGFSVSNSYPSTSPKGKLIVDQVHHRINAITINPM